MRREKDTRRGRKHRRKRGGMSALTYGLLGRRRGASHGPTLKYDRAEQTHTTVSTLAGELGCSVNKRTGPYYLGWLTHSAPVRSLYSEGFRLSQLTGAQVKLTDFYLKACWKQRLTGLNTRLKGTACQVTATGKDSLKPSTAQKPTLKSGFIVRHNLQSLLEALVFLNQQLI